MAFRHEGFWRPMDTLKDKEVLEDLVEQGRMPWLIERRCAPAPPDQAVEQEGRIDRPLSAIEFETLERSEA